MNSEGRSKKAISAAQQDANRRNALRSTGPRTPEGKAVVAKNAVRHGLFARTAFAVPRGPFQESAEEVEAYTSAIVVSLCPRDQLELQVAKSIARLILQSERLDRYSSHALANQVGMPNSDSLERARALCEVLESRKLPTGFTWHVLLKGLRKELDLDYLGVDERDRPDELFWGLVNGTWSDLDQARAWAREIRGEQVRNYDQVLAISVDAGGRAALDGALERATRLGGRISAQLRDAYGLLQRLQRRDLDDGLQPPGQNKPISP